MGNIPWTLNRGCEINRYCQIGFGGSGRMDSSFIIMMTRVIMSFIQKGSIHIYKIVKRFTQDTSVSHLWICLCWIWDRGTSLIKVKTIYNVYICNINPPTREIICVTINIHDMYSMWNKMSNQRNNQAYILNWGLLGLNYHHLRIHYRIHFVRHS